jgi:hypothetical protein
LGPVEKENTEWTPPREGIVAGEEKEYKNREFRGPKSNSIATYISTNERTLNAKKDEERNYLQYAEHLSPQIKH